MPRANRYFLLVMFGISRTAAAKKSSKRCSRSSRSTANARFQQRLDNSRSKVQLFKISRWLNLGPAMTNRFLLKFPRDRCRYLHWVFEVKKAWSVHAQLYGDASDVIVQGLRCQTKLARTQGPELVRKFRLTFRDELVYA